MGWGCQNDLGSRLSVFGIEQPSFDKRIVQHLRNRLDLTDGQRDRIEHLDQMFGREIPRHPVDVLIDAGHIPYPPFILFVLGPIHSLEGL